MIRSCYILLMTIADLSLTILRAWFLLNHCTIAILANGHTLVQPLKFVTFGCWWGLPTIAKNMILLIKVLLWTLGVDGIPPFNKFYIFSPLLIAQNHFLAKCKVWWKSINWNLLPLLVTWFIVHQRLSYFCLYIKYGLTHQVKYLTLNRLNFYAKSTLEFPQILACTRSFVVSISGSSKLLTSLFPKEHLALMISLPSITI